MPLAFRSSAPNIAFGMNHACLMPTGILPGDLLIAVISMAAQSGTAVAPVVSGWTRLAEHTYATSYNASVWVRNADGTESSIFAFTTGANYYSAIGVLAYSEAGVDVFADYGSVQASNGPRPPVITTTVANDILVAIALYGSMPNSYPSTSPAAGWNERVEVVGFNSYGAPIAHVMDKVQTAVGDSGTMPQFVSAPAVENVWTFTLAAKYVAAPVAAPIARFTSAPPYGVAPLTVAFTDTSMNLPTSWLWDFGDGTTSTAQNPTHIFSAVGTYTVTLTATNATGSDSETMTINAKSVHSFPHIVITDNFDRVNEYPASGNWVSSATGGQIDVLLRNRVLELIDSGGSATWNGSSFAPPCEAFLEVVGLTNGNTSVGIRLDICVQGGNSYYVCPFWAVSSGGVGGTWMGSYASMGRAGSSAWSVTNLNDPFTGGNFTVGDKFGLRVFDGKLEAWWWTAARGWFRYHTVVDPYPPLPAGGASIGFTTTVTANGTKVDNFAYGPMVGSPNYLDIIGVKGAGSRLASKGAQALPTFAQMIGRSDAPYLANRSKQSVAAPSGKMDHDLQLQLARRAWPDVEGEDVRPLVGQIWPRSGAL